MLLPPSDIPWECLRRTLLSRASVDPWVSVLGLSTAEQSHNVMGNGLEDEGVLLITSSMH